MLHEFNLEFGDPSPGPETLEPRVREFIERGPKVFLIAGAGPDGFAQIDFHRSVWSDGPIAFLDELYVVPELRGRGLGKAMMEAFLALARERGAAGAEVVTGEGDVEARGLYERFGFRNEIEGEGEERALFYELELAPSGR